ncbi:MAG: hypothetical protein JSS29_19390 [Proteobacteria bacterium]|nr:hypothetical protein [Pseudomonadota bacterium]
MPSTDIDQQLNQFRLSSRELFNHAFRVQDPYNAGGWEWETRFAEVERLLFQKLVREPCGLPGGEYGSTALGIAVVLQGCESVPAMINRGQDTGYWDDPVSRIDTSARLRFVRFFDWDLLAIRDNRYVRIQIESWSLHPGLVGRHALVDSQYLRYAQL